MASTYYTRPTITQGQTTGYNDSINYNLTGRPYNGIQTKALPLSTYWGNLDKTSTFWEKPSELPNLLLNLDDNEDGDNTGLFLLENDNIDLSLAIQ